MRSLPDRARQAVRRDPLGQPDQLRGLHGPQHDDHGNGPDFLLHRQGSELGTGHGLGLLLSAQARGLPGRDGAADQARAERQLPGAGAGADHDDLNGGSRLNHRWTQMNTDKKRLAVLVVAVAVISGGWLGAAAAETPAAATEKA